MSCPKYGGCVRCGFHSEYYILCQETIDKFCNGNYLDCQTFIENSIGLEKRIDINHLKQSVQKSEKNIEHLHSAKELPTDAA